MEEEEEWVLQRAALLVCQWTAVVSPATLPSEAKMAALLLTHPEELPPPLEKAEPLACLNSQVFDDRGGGRG